MSIARDGIVYKLVPITGKKLEFVDYYTETIKLNPGREKKQIQDLCMAMHEFFDLCTPESYQYFINLSVLGVEGVSRDLIFELAINTKLKLRCINNTD